MADLITDTFRKYQEDGSSKASGTSITITKSKTDYSSERGWHPDDAVNQEYIDAGAAKDCERPLCWSVHNGVACRRPVKRGTRYCWKGRGDA